MKQTLAILLSFFLLFPLMAEEVGVVTFIQGKTILTGPRSKKDGDSLKLNQILRKGDTVTTKDGVCEFQLATQASVRMEKFSALSIDEILNPKSKQTSVKLYSGKLFVKAHKHPTEVHKINVVAPNFVAGVRGTEFIVALPDAGGTNEDVKLPEGVFVNEGTVSVSGAGKNKEVLVAANEEIVLAGKELKKQMLNDYAKEKMKIFEHLDQMKEENYKMIKEQSLKNEELMNEMKAKKDI